MREAVYLATCSHRFELPPSMGQGAPERDFLLSPRRVNIHTGGPQREAARVGVRCAYPNLQLLVTPWPVIASLVPKQSRGRPRKRARREVAEAAVPPRNDKRILPSAARLCEY